MKINNFLKKQFEMFLKKDNENIKNNHLLMADLYTAYSKLCFTYGYERNVDLEELRNCSYIIPSQPKTAEDTEDAQIIYNNYDLDKWVTLTEVDDILTDAINAFRNYYNTVNNDIETSSLKGQNSLAIQIISSIFANHGLMMEVHNINEIPNINIDHQFMIVTFNVKQKNQVRPVSFLIDATYREFFASIDCNQGVYYDTEKAKGPAAGYFVCQTPGGQLFASSLLTDGYIELNEKNYGYYIDGFIKSCQSYELFWQEQAKLSNKPVKNICLRERVRKA